MDDLRSLFIAFVALVTGTLLGLAFLSTRVAPASTPAVVTPTYSFDADVDTGVGRTGGGRTGGGEYTFVLTGDSIARVLGDGTVHFAPGVECEDVLRQMSGLSTVSTEKPNKSFEMSAEVYSE